MLNSSVSSRRRSPTTSVATALLPICGIGGCEREEAPLRLGTRPWLGTEPPFLAREPGFLQPHEGQLVDFLDVSQGESALLDGAVDGAAVTLAEALGISARDARFRIVLVADYRYGADVLIAQSSVTDLAALKGARVGLDDEALSAHVLQRALQEGGLTPADVLAGLEKTRFPERATNARQVGGRSPTSAAIAEQMNATRVETASVPTPAAVGALFDHRLAQAIYR